MKNIKVSSTLFSVVCCAFLWSCSKPISTNYQTAFNLTISSVTPTHGGFGTIDTITGKGFDQFPKFDSIKINGKNITIVSKSATQIIVDIPKLAGTGNIVFWSGGKSYTSPVFKYDTLIVVTTFAGSGSSVVKDGTGINASFASPTGITMDLQGNLFVVDNGSCIRKITPEGVVTTFAGSPGNLGYVDAQGTSALFSRPIGIACDANGYLYVTDYLYIRKISPSGMVSTLAGHNNFGMQDGYGAVAGFDQPDALAVDKDFNVYVADELNNNIRKITPDGFVSTIAGGNYYLFGYKDGKDTSARFFNPWGIAVGTSGTLYIADHQNFTVRQLTSDGNVSTLAGDRTQPGDNGGVGMQAHFYFPSSVATNAQGLLFMIDGNFKVWKIDPVTAEVTTYAGGGVGNVDGPVPYASFRAPSDLVCDTANNIYVTDPGNFTIRKITIQ